MYLKHWQLDRKPFTQLFDESLIVFRDSMASAYHTISLAVQLPPAVVWITGPDGSGKSSLLAVTAVNYGDECNLLQIKGPNSNESNSLASVLRPGSSGRLDRLPGGDNQLLAILRSYGSSENKTLLITVDDADAAAASNLYSELETIERVGKSFGVPLSIILTARDAERLPAIHFSSQQQYIDLEAVSTEECGAIIRHRLETAGGSDSIFSDDALNALAEKSNGNIRKLLIFADLCLQVGAIKRIEQIDAAFVLKNIAPHIDKVAGISPGQSAPASEKNEEEQLTETGRFVRLRNSIRSAQAALREGDLQSPVSVDKKSTAPPRTVDEGPSPAEIPSHRLISQIELETYRSTSDREKNRKFVEDLQKKIADGQVNLVEAVKQFDKKKQVKETQPPKKDTGKTEPAPEKPKTAPAEDSLPGKEEELADIDAQLFYHRGLEVIGDVLDSLRDKSFTDLTNVFSLATGITRKVREDNKLLLITLEHPSNYGLHHHLLNIGILTSVCARELEMSDEQCEEATLAGLLHDIGHLHTNEELIQAPIRFDRQDFRVIKRHPVVGRDMIIHLTNAPKKIAEIISQEHERDDGLGYPNYLAGEQIHKASKIIGVCDTFEALSHPRSYRKALSPEEALIQINSGMTRRTDPSIIQALYRAVITALENAK